MNPKIIRSIIWRIVLTVALLFGYCVTIDIYNAVRSPLTGVATAKALDDTMSSYLVAKFIREDSITTLLFTIAILIFMAIWFSLILRIAKTKPEQSAN